MIDSGGVSGVGEGDELGIVHVGCDLSSEGWPVEVGVFVPPRDQCGSLRLLSRSFMRYLVRKPLMSVTARNIVWAMRPNPGLREA